MTFLKRAIATLSVFSVLVVGSLSFFPRSFAVDDYSFDFSTSDVLSLVPSNCPYYCYYAWYWESSDRYYFTLSYSSSPFSLSVRQASNSSLYTVYVSSGSSVYKLSYNSSSGSWSSQSSAGHQFNALGSPFICSSGVSFSGFDTYSEFTYHLNDPSEPVSSLPKFLGYSPFYFPQLPYGVFDGNLDVVDGTYQLQFDWSSLSSQYDFSDINISGDVNIGILDIEGSVSSHNNDFSGYYDSDTGYFDGQLYSDGGNQYQNELFVGNAYVNTDGYFTANAIDGVVTGSYDYDSDSPPSFRYVPSKNENSRFRTWAIVSEGGYHYFICDTRNKITGSLESVSGDTATWRFRAQGDDGVYYPFFCVDFDYFGTVVGSSSQLPNGFYKQVKAGTLSQDSDTGVWSVSPLYHGFWLSPESPPLSGMGSLTQDYYTKWLANPIFGESAFIISFLDSINHTIENSISNQTSALVNADAPAQSQPSSSELIDYFADSSVFDAPDTDSVFTGDAEHIFSTGHIYEGVSWWTSKFNDIVNDNAILVSYITTMLTIGLAVLIIGRKVGSV